MSKNTISRWGDSPALYVAVYVDALIEIKKLEKWNEALQDQRSFDE